jgi:hypothetical protein
MEIKINLEEILGLKINPTQYLLLYLKYHNSSILDHTLVTALNINKNDLIKLEGLGLIKITNSSLLDFVLREPAKNLFTESPDHKLFYEFWGTYPMKVPNGAGGYRILRAKDPNAQSAEKIKEKYLRIIKKQGKHKQIMEGLDGYLKENRSKLQYLQGVEVFLNQATWEKYIGVRDVEMEGFSNDI